MLPTSALGNRDTIEQKALIARAIEAHLQGTVSIDSLAAWSLKAFHSIHSDEQDGVGAQDEDIDVDDDDDGSEVLEGDDALIQQILDTLMFADAAEFTPTHIELATMVSQLTR